MKEWLKRAIRTFLQAMLGFITANIAIKCSGGIENGSSKELLLGFLGSAVAAGLAAVMNMQKGTRI